MFLFPTVYILIICGDVVVTADAGGDMNLSIVVCVVGVRLSMLVRVMVIFVVVLVFRGGVFGSCDLLYFLLPDFSDIASEVSLLSLIVCFMLVRATGCFCCRSGSRHSDFITGFVFTCADTIVGFFRCCF